MDIEKFAEEVLASAKEKGGGTFKAQSVTVEKNNGITLMGITGGDTGSIARPCVYLDGYYEKYKNGYMGADEVAEEIHRRILEHENDLKGINMDDFTKWERVKPYIHAKLINMEKNRKMLARMPWKRFLDLAVVYYVKLDGITDGGEAYFLVKDRHMEMWGQDESSIYHEAMANMHRNEGPRFENMDKVIRGIAGGDMLPSTPGERDMYVLSNRAGLFGAAEILDDGNLKMISDKMGGDFIVLPSSIHESIIIPADGRLSHPALAAMVYDINRMQVDVEERLSDHIYLYERAKGELGIAA